MEGIKHTGKTNENTLKYIKKFSFGISLNIELENYKKIIEKYSEYINSIYFSPPFGEEFHTRNLVKKEYNQKDAETKLINILRLFKDNGIKLEVAINQYGINLEKLKKSLNILDCFIKVDSICCLDEYVDIINEHYKGKMYLVSSFNNTVSGNEMNKYDMIVLAKKYMRETKMLEYIKSKNIDIKLLVNNGCAFNCKTCRAGARECKNTFNKNIQRYTAEELYAVQSLFPWELEELFARLGNNDIIKEIKISSRPSSYEYIDNCLESYIYNVNPEKYININARNYHLWGRQANLIKYFDSFRLEEIQRIKRKLWEM